MGATVAESMRLCTHVIELRKPLTKLVCTLKRVMRCEWGLNKRSAKFIYMWNYVRVHSVVRFCTDGTGLETALCLSIRGVVSVSSGMSHVAIQVLLGVPPLDLEVVRRATAYKPT